MKNYDDYFKRLERRIGLLKKGADGFVSRPASKKEKLADESPLPEQQIDRSLDGNALDTLLSEWEKPKKSRWSGYGARIKSALHYKIVDIINIVFGVIFAVYTGWSVQTSVEGVFQSAFFVGFLFYICAGLFVMVKVGSTNRLAGWTIFIPFFLFVLSFYAMRGFFYPNFLGDYFDFILLYLFVSIGVLFENRTLENGMLSQKETPLIFRYRRGFTGVIFSVAFGIMSICARVVRFFLPYWAIGILFFGVGLFFLGRILQSSLIVMQNSVQSWYLLLMVMISGMSQFVMLKKAWKQDKIENLITSIVEPLGMCLKFVILSIWVANLGAFPENTFGLIVVYTVLFWPIQMRFLFPFLDDFISVSHEENIRKIQNQENQ